MYGPTFILQRITRRFALRHIHNAVHVEANFLRTSRPSLVAETVDMLAVVLGVEAVITGGDGPIVHYIGICWVNDLVGREDVSE